MLHLTDHFTRTAVISLPARHERRARLLSNLTGCRIHPGGITWVDAADGSQLRPPDGWTAGPGAWGCLQSHLQVLSTAERDGVESVLVLEDDAVFHPLTSHLLPEVMRSLPPDWAQLYLGGQHLAPARPTGSPFLVVPSNVNRTHAYAVSRAGLPAVLSWMRRTADYLSRPGWHVDHQLGAAHQAARWPVFAPSWWLAGQADCQSDISGQTLPQRWWHPARWAFHLPIFLLSADATPEDTAALWLPPAEHTPDLATCPLPCALAFLHSTAAAALDLSRLPALPALSPATLDRLRPLWPAGFRPCPPGAAAAAVLYPCNGLLPHPLAAFPGLS